MSEQKESVEAKSCCEGAGGKRGTPEFSTLVPEDKRLSPEWLASLYARGEPEVYSGNELQHIGMPIGGICAGQVYLGGDGRLWHWDVFKAYGGSGEEIDPRGLHYKDPVTVKSPFDQGFALRIESEAEKPILRLDKEGFDEIDFEGRYPVGYVNYRHKEVPIEASLEAYSPFIPLDENNSGLPVTVMEYTLRNTSDKPVSLSIGGWLENKVCRYDDEPGKGSRRNDIARTDNVLMLSCFADKVEGSNPAELEGYGNMSLALLDSTDDDAACCLIDSLVEDKSIAASMFEQLEKDPEQTSASQLFGTKTVGAVGRHFELLPGEEKTVRFAIAWYFPAYSGGYVFHSTMEDLPDLENIKRHYAAQFDSSQEVISYLADNYPKLSSETKLWVETWYDSTLPYWLLNRIFGNTSTLATQTCHWFDSGRFYAWEGVDCCQGTCQHVWQYAQSIARLFPAFERSLREHVDYDIAFKSDGSLEYRAEANISDVDMKSENDAEAFFAADGQLGTILRVYREHTMSADSGFLNRIWPRVKKSIEFMMTLDEDEDGLLDTAQFHTLDTSWYGQIPWISSLFLAALAAGKQMAIEMEDQEFAATCNTRLEAGKENITEKLFNGEYFVHKPNPNKPESMNLTQGSYIDQVFGQGYAIQLGLERVIPKEETVSALQSLWKYNYTPDVGPYREGFNEVEGGRWYAMPGEGGLLMCTWPKNDCNRADYEQKILGLDVTSEGYLNECMSGFEYQVASHMMAEGLVKESLAITRTIHDRYHASKRNPWNEVECSDHYSRAMSCYGIFLNACGFQYHGPKGHLTFSPKLQADNFKAAFTVAEGWGSYAQSIANNGVKRIELGMKYGRLNLNVLTLSCVLGRQPSSVRVCLNDQNSLHNLDTNEDCPLSITFHEELQLVAGDKLVVEF